jgi:pimeloyl-ACP methyl ester carboxylesterase
MPLIRLSVRPDTGRAGLHGSPQCHVAALRRAARDGSGPIVLMVHGYKYIPHSRLHCPHTSIFDTSDGWPAALGVSGDAGLGICFGWDARGPLRDVFRKAGTLGAELAQIVALIARCAPLRPVHLIAHSMGAEVALAALTLCPPRAVSRVILLTGASLQSHAAAALASPAGRTTELFNITSRENDLFDFAFERLLGGRCPGDHALGQGIAARNAIDVQLDCPQTLAQLADLGLPVAPSMRRVCHWSGYTRPGALSFYAALIHRPDALPMDLLRTRLPPISAPRWSRIPLAGIAKRRIMPAKPQEIAA